MSSIREIDQIMKDLRVQVASLQSNLKAVEKEAPKDSPPSHLFDGPMVASLMSQSEPEWFSKFLRSLNAMTCQHLMLCTLLSLRQSFKQILLSSPELQSMFLSPIKLYDPLPTDIDSVIWYKSLMYSLFISKEDKPRIISPQLKSAGYTFSEQTTLEESIARNPQMASALGAGQGEEWNTSLEDANVIQDLLITEALIEHLVKAKAVEALSCACRQVKYRNLVVRKGGVQAILEGASKTPSREHREQVQVALARLCISIDPHLWKYPQNIDLSNVCFDLVSSADYELYQFEAGIGLTNLLSTSEEVLEHIGSKGNSVSSFFELISASQDERIQLVGAELFCNLCRSETVVQKFIDGAFREQLKLIPFLIEKGSEQMQSASSGALAILSSNEALIPALGEIIADGAWLIQKVSSTDVTEDVELRIASIMSNIIIFSDNSRLISDLSRAMREIKIKAESREQESFQTQRLLSLVQSYS